MNRKTTILLFTSVVTSALILSAAFPLGAVGAPSPSDTSLRAGTEQTGSGPKSGIKYRGGPSASPFDEAHGFYGQAAPARYFYGNLIPQAPGSSTPAPGGNLHRAPRAPGGALHMPTGGASPNYQNVDYKHHERIILPPILDSFG